MSGVRRLDLNLNNPWMTKKAVHQLLHVNTRLLKQVYAHPNLSIRRLHLHLHTNVHCTLLHPFGAAA
jgi:hypothetical protein